MTAAQGHALHRSERRAWVTGASSGIGAAFAARLAQDGWDLALVARNRVQLDDLAQTLRARQGVAVDVLPADLTDADARRGIERALAGDDSLALLVNNAGFGTAGTFAHLDVEREEAEIRLNVVAVARLTRAALPGMLARRRGAVINVSSMAGFQAGPRSATYAATKAFVNSFTESLHEELRGSGVRVQALCPGFTRTECQARAGIDAGGIPSFAWMTAGAVVDAALAGLERGDVICVPGFGNRLLARAAAALPRAAVRRLMGVAGRQVLGE
jgi:uncharacterized protein